MELSERLPLERHASLAAERLPAPRGSDLASEGERLAKQSCSITRAPRGRFGAGMRSGAPLADGMVLPRSEASQNRRSPIKATSIRPGQLTPPKAAPEGESPNSWPAPDLLSDGIALFDQKLRLLAANRTFCSCFGLDATAGPDLSTIPTRARASGRIRPGDLSRQDWLEIAAAPAPETSLPDLLLQRPDCGWTRLAPHHTAQGDLLLHLVDITPRMQPRAALEAIPDGFVLFNSEDRMVIRNRSYRDIYQTSAQIMPPRTSLEQILRHGLASGDQAQAEGREEDRGASRMQEHRSLASEGGHQLKDGNWLRCIDKKTPDGGRVGLRVGIPQLRAQARALDSARAAAEQASRANMCHQIRAPMDGVVGIVDLLCDTAFPDEQRRLAATIRSSGEALMVILNDSPDYSRIEAGQLTLPPGDFDFERIIHEVMLLLQPGARQKGVDLMIDYDVIVPTRFTGDPGRLRQVLTTLIGNAVKFTDRGHVLTRVTGIETADGRQQLHVTIEDTGIGIPAGLIDQVFGAFVQVEAERNRRFEGSGPGLTITRRLIERREGAVWVDSETGKGSVFGFRVALPPAGDAGPERMPVAPGLVMLVDDQFISRTVLERQLTPCGIGVTHCHSGEEALAQIAAGTVPPPDMVLADHEMPGMDGVTLSRKLREAGFERPVILLSSSPLEARAVPDPAFTAILQKPVLRAELYRLLTSLSSPPEPAPATPSIPAPAPPGLRAMRILAAEDNRTTRLVLQKMLRDLDIELRFAGNGSEALAEWQGFHPDLIIMDVSMPGMDGREATRAIRAIEAAEGRRPVPIVALTAHATEGDTEGILAAGMDLCLTKPLRKSELAAVVARFTVENCRRTLPP